MPPLERTYHVFRLLEEDKKLLKSVASKFRTMHQAMEALTPIVQQLELEPAVVPKRYPVRVPIPSLLHTELKDLSDKTGIPMVDILLRAARKFEADASGN